MNIIDWLKKVLKKMTKKDYMLNEANEENNKTQKNRNFVKKVDISNNYIRTREDFLTNIRNEMILKAVSETENTETFGRYLQNTYKQEFNLTQEDVNVINDLYEAIKEGNKQEQNVLDNKISQYIKEKPNNIVKLVNEILKKSENENEKVDKTENGIKENQELDKSKYSYIIKVIEGLEEEEYIQE